MTIFVGNNVIEEAGNVHIEETDIVAMVNKALILVGMETVPLMQLRWHLSKVINVFFVLRVLLRRLLK